MKKVLNRIIKLEKISGNKSQSKILYDLLKSRIHNISHISLPTFEKHINFVKNHPYRFWYLVKIDKVYVGTVYIMDTNCIGISLPFDCSALPEVLGLIFNKHKPLKEKKSVRPGFFYINISPENKSMESELIKINARKVQMTYLLDLTCKI